MPSYIRKNKHNCPSCGYGMDAAMNLNDSEKGKPVPGDFALCLSCGTILRYYDKKLFFKIATQKDLEEMDTKDYKRVLHASAYIKKHKPLQNKKY